MIHEEICTYEVCKLAKEKAQELFEFICKNVELPDTPLTQWKDVINQADDIAKMIKEYLVQTVNAQKANENTAK